VLVLIRLSCHLNVGSAGVCLGLSIATLGSQLMSRFVFGVSALEPALYAGAAALLFALACAVAFVPSVARSVSIR
jgi:hypothetical protein